MNKPFCFLYFSKNECLDTTVTVAKLVSMTERQHSFDIENTPCGTIRETLIFVIYKVKLSFIPQMKSILIFYTEFFFF